MPTEQWFEKKIEEYEPLLRKYKSENPLLNSAQLARLILQKEKLKLASENIRQMLRRLPSKPKSISLDDEIFEIEIPESFYKERERFIIPAGIDR